MYFHRTIKKNVQMFLVALNCSLFACVLNHSCVSITYLENEVTCRFIATVNIRSVVITKLQLIACIFGL